MTRPESQKPRLFKTSKKRRQLPVEKQNEMARSEYDIEMDRHEAFLKKLNKENGIEVD